MLREKWELIKFKHLLTNLGFRSIRNCIQACLNAKPPPKNIHKGTKYQSSDLPELDIFRVQD